MKKHLIWAIPVAIIHVIAALAFVVIFGSNQRGEGLAAPFSPLVSPSGQYQLDVKILWRGHFFNRFVVYEMDQGNRSPEAVFTCDYSFPTRFTTFFMWDEYDRVWVSNGEYGTHFWAKEGNGWQAYGIVVSEGYVTEDGHAWYYNDFGERKSILCRYIKDVEVPQRLKELRPDLDVE